MQAFFTLIQLIYVENRNLTWKVSVQVYFPLPNQFQRRQYFWAENGSKMYVDNVVVDNSEKETEWNKCSDRNQLNNQSTERPTDHGTLGSFTSNIQIDIV